MSFLNQTLSNMASSIRLFFILGLFIIVKSTIYSQAISKEVLIEDSLHQFDLSYNLTQKLIDSTSIQSTSIQNQELFKLFMKKELRVFYMSNYSKMISGIISSRDLSPAYNDYFNSLKNSSTFMNRFTLWKTQYSNLNHIGHSHTVESGNCDNVDFELGTWQHWFPYVADVNFPGTTHTNYAIQNLTTGTSGFGANAQHTIVTGGVDMNAPAITKLNPRGGTYSIQLGDEGGGFEVSRIIHKAQITAFKPYFTYDFAVVFNDPSGHPANEVPFFTVEFLDTNNLPIPSCGNYDVISQTTAFQRVGTSNWKYKPWARITVDLSNYIGQEITVQFTVADCGYGAHAGRAYIDGNCFLPEIKKTQDCKGIFLEADSGYLSYQWYGGTPTALLPGDTNQGFYIPGPGLYKVELISENGCTLLIDTLINDIYVILNQTITQVDPSCIGVNDGSITINAFGGQAPYTYSINNGATTSTNNSFTGLAPGTYTCIVYDSGGCSDTLIYNLTNPPNIIPNLIIEDAKCFSICNGEVEAVPSGGTSPTGNYLVEFDNVFSVTKKRTNLCAGLHTVKITDENGCFTINTFNISEPLAETIDQVIIGDENCYNACDGSITIIDATASEYSIDNGSTWQTGNVFSNLCAAASPYLIALKTVDGCIARSIAIINQPLPLVLTPIPDTFICLNKFASINAIPLGGTPPYSVSWSNGSTGFTMTESPAVSTTYTVTVTDALGCSYTEEFNINLHPQPIANFTFDPGPETDVFNTKVNFTNTTDYGAPLDYEWVISDFMRANTRDTYFEFPANGGKRFLNCLKVENQFGCRDSICKPFFIKYEVLLYAPNTFTPNDDDVNEVFLPIVEGLTDEGYKLMIFNRWGELMFSTTSQTEGWNGRYKGQKVEEDAYVWRIVGVTKQTGEDYENFGHITVLNKL